MRIDHGHPLSVLRLYMDDAVNTINQWMITHGRCSDDPIKVVCQYCTMLQEANVPLWRVNIGQRFANPLLIAWGVIWTPENTETYNVPYDQMITSDYLGSSFQYIHENQKPLHKSLLNLDPVRDHSSYLEYAAAGGTDYYATLLDYGDGSQHGCTFATKAKMGFNNDHLQLIEATKPGLSSALEPMTMRKTAQSLLRTYLGDGPSQAVWNGSIILGERTDMEAVVMFSDLRGFTELSDSVSKETMFDALSDYFELVVKIVQKNNGDVLKFMGDGILSIFPVSKLSERNSMCRMAALAAQNIISELSQLNTSRTKLGKFPLQLGIGINLGSVSYGNIGSPSRLDFTVLGSAVNIASRIEGLTKSVEANVLATAAIANAAPEMFQEQGIYPVRGVRDPQALFRLVEHLT